MFTWEEAGQLRGMILVVKWFLVALVLGLVLLEHEPLGAALVSCVHMVQNTLQPGTPAPNHSAAH